MKKKVLRQGKLPAGRDPNETTTSVQQAAENDQEIIIDGKRLEEIMMELEDLKD